MEFVMRKRDSYAAFFSWEKNKGHWIYYGTRRKEIRFPESTVLTASYFVCYDTLLQNVTDIIRKCDDSYFITKCDKSLMQNVSFFYYKMRQFYYKTRQLLQRKTILLQIATFITKCFISLHSSIIQKMLEKSLEKNRNT